MKKRWPYIYPLLFSAAPVLILYSHNIDMVSLDFLVRPIGWSLVGASFIFLIGWWLSGKNIVRAAIITSIFIIWFYSIGHLAASVDNDLLPGLNIRGENIVMAIGLIIVFFSCLIIITAKRGFKGTTIFLSIFAIAVNIMPAGRIMWHELTYNNYQSRDSISWTASNNNSLPDIYYIILDGYGRQDVLAEIYNHDNSQVADNLRQMGFYIAEKSVANYPQTYLSMASALNYQYLDQVRDEQGVDSYSRKPLREMIKNSQLVNYLKQNGYQTVVFPAIWAGLYNNLEADIIMSGELTISEFESLLINTTPVGFFFDKAVGLDIYRKKIKHAFNTLPQVAEIADSTFTYLHIMSPHPPFVFDEYGNSVNPKHQASGLDGSHYFEIYPDRQEYRGRYVSQLKFVNSQLIPTLESIIEKSGQPPIIIIQSDHGPGSMLEWEKPDSTNMKERLSIMNAYLLPETAEPYLYPGISPVNSFRLILNDLFDAGLDLLADRSYFATWSRPYDFIDVTEELQ